MTVHFIGFSVIGLALYGLLELIFDLVPPFHVIPQSYAPESLRVETLSRVLVPYVGHVVCSGVVGAVAALLDRLVCRLTSASSQPSTWDYFLEESLPRRWSVITLMSGDVYAGFIRSAEHSAAASERDLVLGQPARLDPVTGNYEVTSYSDLFLPAHLIQSIGAIRLDPELQDKPVPGSHLFPRVYNDGQDSAATTTSTAGRDPQGQLPADTTGFTTEGPTTGTTVESPREEID
jgi:hypothetical protein